jgi:hypothetical protein
MILTSHYVHQEDVVLLQILYIFNIFFFNQLVSEIPNNVRGNMY